MLFSVIQRRLFIRLIVLAPLLTAVYWLAWAVRYDFHLPKDAWERFSSSLPVVLGIELFAALALQRWHEWMRYVSFRDLVVLATTLSMAHLGIVLFDWVWTRELLEGRWIPPSVILLNYLLGILALGGVSSAWRFQHEHLRPLVDTLLWRRVDYRPALLVGANRTGVVLANQIQFHPRLKYKVVGFLDADASLHGGMFGGIPVRGGLANAAEAIQASGAIDLFVLDGSLPGETLRLLVNQCSGAGIHVKIIANIYDLVHGNSRSKLSVRDVDINDLLRREPVQLDNDALGAMLADKVVIVTGAGGSIGSEICRQVARFKPRSLVLVEQAENSLFFVERELRAAFPEMDIVPFVADITEERRMRQLFESGPADVLFHAAAHKHVPMMESNPSEAIANNILGTKLVADLSHEFGLKSFVMISTDKAVRPTSVMGLSKQIAERYVNALSQASSTRFVVVRFGNVLGSAGSVVPIFQQQILRGGPVTITHPEMRRYFMTIPEASQLVLQAGAMGTGGEIFVLDMGEPVKIIDLARDLIRLSGVTENEVEIKITGVRPGEKLYEELYFDDEQSLPTQHPKLRAAQFRPEGVDEIDHLIEDLRALMYAPNPIDVHLGLKRLFPEFGMQRSRSESEAAAPSSALAQRN